MSRTKGSKNKTPANPDDYHTAWSKRAVKVLRHKGQVDSWRNYPKKFDMDKVMKVKVDLND